MVGGRGGVVGSCSEVIVAASAAAAAEVGETLPDKDPLALLLLLLP